MIVQPKKARTTPISAIVQGVKVRYDPAEHLGGVTVPDDVGQALVNTRHWVEVAPPQRNPRMSKMPTIADSVPEATPDDGIQS